MRCAFIGAAQEPEGLEAIDSRRLEVVPSAALDLRLAEPRADSFCARGQGCRLAGEGVRVDGEVDLAHAFERTAAM